MSHPATVLIYARTASATQGNEQDQGLLEQVQACREYSVAHGYNEANCHVASDEGYPGLEMGENGKAKQNYGPGMRTLIHAAIGGGVNVVIFSRRDRVTRDPTCMLRSTPRAPSPRSKVISPEDEASGERYRNPQVQALYKSVLDSLAAEHPELDHILSRLRKAPKDLREQAIKELAPDIGKLIFAALSSSGGAKSRSKR